MLKQFGNAHHWIQGLPECKNLFVTVSFHFVKQLTPVSSFLRCSPSPLDPRFALLCLLSAPQHAAATGVSGGHDFMASAFTGSGKHLAL